MREHTDAQGQAGWWCRGCACPVAWCSGAQCRAGPVAYSRRGSGPPVPVGGVLRRAASRRWGSGGCPREGGGGGSSGLPAPGHRRRRSPLPSGAAGLGGDYASVVGHGAVARASLPALPGAVPGLCPRWPGVGRAGGFRMVGGPPRPPMPWCHVPPAHSSSHILQPSGQAGGGGGGEPRRGTVVRTFGGPSGGGGGGGGPPGR